MKELSVLVVAAARVIAVVVNLLVNMFGGAGARGI